MEYRRLGRSGLKTSALGLGTWLTLGDHVTSDAAKSIVDIAIGNGINFIDLADAYAGGDAEREMGRLLKQFDRDRLVISSKVFWPMSDDPNDQGLSRKHLFISIDRSLKNLSTDYLDIYFCHRQDPETPVEETVMAMDDLIRQGKVLYWGTSMWEFRTLKKAVRFAARHGLHAPVAEQLPYNLLERWIEKKLRAYRRLGIGLTTWSPLAGGLLTGKYLATAPQGSRGERTNWLDKHRSADSEQKISRFVELAQSFGCEPAQLALAWALHNRAISSVILGASSPQQLQSNLDAQKIALAPTTLTHINQLFR